ncbi:hypothetical protein Q8F55_002084 [Vanrija albida]|uniref:Uncharacterized protein n=1 Tax=Vanrija albida TaxID=181172 RepID=A0ABR3Q8S2_9TREE
MSITMNSSAGRKGKRGPTSPSHSTHSPPINTSPLPKIKLSIRPTTPQSRASSSGPRSRGQSSSNQRRSVFSDSSSSSDLTPADDDETEDEDMSYMPIPIRKGKKRESLSTATPSSKDKGKGRAFGSSPHTNPAAQDRPAMAPRPTTSGPSGRERKRKLKLGEVARRRARDDKFGFGGDRFGGSVTPTQTRFPKPPIDSDSTSSYGDDESDRENTQSLFAGDETEDEEIGGLPEAFAGQEIEDLHYGAGPVVPHVEEDTEQEWWQEEEDDEDVIAQLSGSDLDGLQSQSSVHASESDDPMSSSETSDTDEALDEFGFPQPFGTGEAQTASDAPLILMENWDGQFVLVQPRNDRSRATRRGDRSSRTGGSVGESASASAGEQQLVIDADADDTESDWSAVEDGDDDGGDTTDSMAEEDMPVLDSPALDEIIGQQLTSGFGGVTSLVDLDMTNLDVANLDMAGLDVTSLDVANLDVANLDVAALDMAALDMGNPSIIVTDTTVDSPALSTTSSMSTPAPATVAPVTPVPVAVAPAPALPMMGTFHVSDEPCAHAVIDGTGGTTKSPFTRRRRTKTSDTASISSTVKRRSSLNSADPFSPSVKKVRYSSIPGHPRYIAARRAAQALVDERESTPSEDEAAFSLEDMLDASVLRVNDLDGDEDAGETQDQLRHLFRFDKVPVSMYMRRNFNSSKRAQHDHSPVQGAAYNAYSSPIGRSSHGPTALGDTLMAPQHPASRMLISPLLQPVSGTEYDESSALSRKDRRKARKRAEVAPLQI